MKSNINSLQQSVVYDFNNARLLSKQVEQLSRLMDERVKAIEYNAHKLKLTLAEEQVKYPSDIKEASDAQFSYSINWLANYHQKSRVLFAGNSRFFIHNSNDG